MKWIEFLLALSVVIVAFAALFLMWHLEKPERELRKKRLVAEWEFYCSADWFFRHIARNIDSYEATLNRIETALIGIEMCHSYFVDENIDSQEEK